MAQKNTGGVCKITFVPMTGSPKELSVRRAATVREALVVAGVPNEDIANVRLDGKSVTENTKISGKKYLMVLAQVSGGAK